jgi:hypothetical protein
MAALHPAVCVLLPHPLLPCQTVQPMRTHPVGARPDPVGAMFEPPYVTGTRPVEQH